MPQLTFKQKVARTSSPILIWTDEGERFAPVLLQYAFMASLLVVSAGFPLFFFLGLQVIPIIMWVAGGIGSVASLICFMDTYFSGRYRNIDYYNIVSMSDIGKKLKRNISHAAQKSVESDKKIKLSHYIGVNYRSFGDSEYLASLSPRHIRSIKRTYKNEVRRLRYEATKGTKEYEENLKKRISELDALSSSDEVKKTRYQIKGLEEIRRNPSLSRNEKMEKELSEL